MSSVFNENDFNSGDGMITSIWGPPLWHVLHTVSFNYPIKPTKEQMEHYFNFYSNLENILPCKFCRDNLKNNLKNIPLTLKIMKSRNTLSKWVYELHETINKMLGKKSNLSYEQVRERYEFFRSRCIQDPSEKKQKKHHNGSKIESGCVEPLYGVKSKCILNIVPRDNRKKSFVMDPKCKLKK
jgi:hypothetical protein